MRTCFLLLSASVILASSAFPQSSNGTLPPQGGTPLKRSTASGFNQASDAANLVLTEALKQSAGNAFSQDSAQRKQQLRHPLLLPPQVSPWTGPFSKIGPYGNGLDLGIRRQELLGVLPNPSKECAIPLLEVPVDGNLDKGIRIPHSMQSGSSADSKMAVPPPAPSCDDQSATQLKLKAK